jgi:PAS domain S-box-containing protein
MTNPTTTVLYVDDDTILVDLVRDIVQTHHEDISIHTALTGDEGLAKLEALDDVDCVISDYEMPGMNGLELLDAVRQQWPDLPFILFTGEGDEETAEKAINAGVTDYMQKQTGMAQFGILLNRVRKVVAQRRTEAELRRELRIEKEHFQMALENSPFFAFRLDADLRYTWVANPHEDFAAVEVLGKRDDELLPPEAAEILMGPKRKALETGERVREEVTYELPSGEVTYDLTVEPLRNESGEIVGLTCASLDITERKQYERNLELDSQRTGAQLQLLVETVEDYAIYFLDTEGYVQTWNTGAENLTGYTSDEVIGEHFSLFYREEDVEAGVPERNLSDAAERKNVTETGWRVRKDGSEFWADVRITALREEDELLGYAKIVRDSSQQKREQDLLEQKEQLERFIATISHDLRNPLLVVDGYIGLARKTGDLSRLDPAESAIERATELLDYIRRVAEEGEHIIEPEPVDLREVAEVAWGDIVTEEATLHIEGDAVLVADRMRLQQVLRNLFENAVKHASPRVEVTIGPLDGGFYVEDDGPGIPEAERAKVFEMGYSGNAESSGSGLAIAKQIVEVHGWAIEVTDGTEGGARIEVSGVEVA